MTPGALLLLLLLLPFFLLFFLFPAIFPLFSFYFFFYILGRRWQQLGSLALGRPAMPWTTTPLTATLMTTNCCNLPYSAVCLICSITLASLQVARSQDGMRAATRRQPSSSSSSPDTGHAMHHQQKTPTPTMHQWNTALQTRQRKNHLIRTSTPM